MQLYFDFYKSPTDWQWNKNGKTYMQPYQLKKDKKHKE